MNGGTPQHVYAPPPSRRGFSFVELVMAMALTGLIGLAAVTLTNSLTGAWSDESVARQNYQMSSQRTRGYLNRTLRESVGIGYWNPGSSGAATLFIWANDSFSGNGVTSGDHRPQYGEMYLLQYDSAGKRLMLYTPKSYSAMTSTERSQAALTLTDAEYQDANTAAALATMSWVRPHAVVGRSSAQTTVEEAEFYVGDGTGRPLVEYRLQLLVGGVLRTFSGSVTLRQPYRSDDWDDTGRLRTAATGP